MNLQIDAKAAVWSTGTDAVLQNLGVDPSLGLEESEVLRRRAVFGRNQLQVAKQKHLVRILVDQFMNIVVLLLAGQGYSHCCFRILPKRRRFSS